MVKKLWDKFSALNLSGSVATNCGQIEIMGERDSWDSIIYKAIFELDPDYTQACIIKRNSPNHNFEQDSRLQELDVFDLSQEQMNELLENAILEGLGHQKSFRIKNSGDLVKFGYGEDILF